MYGLQDKVCPDKILSCHKTLQAVIDVPKKFSLVLLMNYLVLIQKMMRRKLQADPSLGQVIVTTTLWHKKLWQLLNQPLRKTIYHSGLKWYFSSSKMKNHAILFAIDRTDFTPCAINIQLGTHQFTSRNHNIVGVKFT